MQYQKKFMHQINKGAAMSEANKIQNITYKNRLFGDVLRELIYTMGEDTYSFVKLSGLHNVMISNLLNHKKYPGAATLNKIAPLLPESMQKGFVAYFMDPATRERSVDELRKRGIIQPYAYSSRYDKERTYTGMYTETDKDNLSVLQLQGLFKYLTAEEKDIFKERIITYIVDRNMAMKQALARDNKKVSR